LVKKGKYKEKGVGEEREWNGRGGGFHRDGNLILFLELV
jgi:hypothetical protein